MVGGAPRRDEQIMLGMYAKSNYSHQGHPKLLNHYRFLVKANRDLYWQQQNRKKMKREMTALVTIAKALFHTAHDKAMVNNSCIFFKKTTWIDNIK